MYAFIPFAAKQATTGQKCFPKKRVKPVVTLL
jgi:hypothetical protein